MFVYIYICIDIHTYVDTYVRTYVCTYIRYLTVPYLTFPSLANLHYITLQDNTYINAYIHVNTYTYIYVAHRLLNFAQIFQPSRSQLVCRCSRGSLSTQWLLKAVFQAPCTCLGFKVKEFSFSYHSRDPQQILWSSASKTLSCWVHKPQKSTHFQFYSGSY